MLQVLFGIRSERQLVEQLRYNMLYRWFVGLPLHEQPWDHSTFTKNRERLLEGGTPEVLFNQVLDCARAEKLLSDEHFSVDGTLIRAWASQASFVRKDGSDDEGDGSNFRGREREPTTRTPRRPTRMRDCTRRAKAPKPIWPIWDTRSPRTGMALQWPRHSPTPPAPPSVKQRWR
jgi:hypothetical protein